MLDVWLPTADGRWVVMPRFTQPEPDQAILLHQLKLELPQQGRRELKLNHESLNSLQKPSVCSADLFDLIVENQRVGLRALPLLRKTGWLSNMFGAQGKGPSWRPPPSRENGPP